MQSIDQLVAANPGRWDPQIIEGARRLYEANPFHVRAMPDAWWCLVLDEEQAKCFAINAPGGVS